MRFVSRWFTFLGGLALVATGLTVQPARAGEGNEEALKQIRLKMQEYVDQQVVSGAVTLVGRKSGIVSLQAVGLRNISANEPMTPDTVFRIASMTKPITAIGIMQLAEQGKLSVDDPVEKHLPEFKGQRLIVKRDGDAITTTRPRRLITIRDLLTHTSGMPGSPPEGLADLYLKRNRTLSEAVHAFSQRPLDYEPGTKWAYCNTGIDTLGRIIEVVSGETFEGYLQAHVFGPLGMKDTTFFPSEAQLARTALSYELKDGKLQAGIAVLDLPKGSKYPVPAGGLYSTAPDLARLYQAMLGRGALGDVRIIGEQSLATMTKVQTGNLQTGFTDGMGFGYGFQVVNTPTGVTAMLSPGTFGHGGAFGTQAWIDPQQDLFVVLLIQRIGMPNGDASDIRRDFQKLAVEAVK